MAKAVLTTYPAEYLRCRYYHGHAFDYNANLSALEEPHPKHPSAVCIVSVCASCGTERVDYLLKSGVRARKSRYRPAEGYRLENGREVAASDKVGRELYRRVITLHR